MDDFITVPRFSSLFRPGENTSELLIVMSSAAVFNMTARPFSRDVLHLAPIRSPYYVRSAEALARALREKAASYQRIIFLGGSKSGFGALLLAGLCAEADPRGYYRALAMSPQVGLYPVDPDLPFPSYHSMVAKAQASEGLMKALVKNGDLSRLAALRNFHATIVYGDLNVVDRDQAALLSGPNIRKIPVHTAAHNTTMFFGPRPYNEKRLRATLTRVYDRPVDADVAATRPDVERLVRDVADAAWLPSLDALIDEVAAVGPR